jgi:extracellular elastinolytic metalloproteinase
MRRLVFLAVIVFGLASVLSAQENEQIADLSSKAARATRAANGARLTGASNAPRPDIVSSFLRTRHDDATLGSLVVDGEVATPRGPIHLRLRQQLAGLEVYGTYVKATLTPAGELLAIVENLASVSGPLLPAQIEYREALGAVLNRRYPGVPNDLPEVASEPNKVSFARGAQFAEPPTVTRVAVPLTGRRMGIGYLVETWDRDNQLWHTIVSGNGRVLFEELRTAADRYNVFPNAPDQTPQTVVIGPGLGNAESPEGWLVSNTSTTTTGNNVDAYLDRDNSNTPDAGGRPVSATRDFLTAADLLSAPTTSANQMVAVTNLFYLNNVIHDKLYQHGFTEAAGNFQANNFGNGGAGDDPVNAEAQDGGGINNANFATPVDGARPRMQMYLWNTASPNRDGSVDSDIVFHEYGHGLTWRMIGNMNGPLAGGIGEGMSDTLAIYLNRDDVVAEYSSNDPLGIRRFPYTNYPYTYDDVTAQSVHNNGEIYAATMWKLLERWEQSGRSQDTLFDYIVDGMNYTPPAPAYEDMRDGILAAAPTAEEDCLIWTVFAEFGIGSGADGRASCNFFGCTVSITESFAIPSNACSPPPPNAPPAVVMTSPTNGSTYAQGVAVSFSGTATDEDGSLTGSLTWTSSLQGTLGTGGSFSRSDLIQGTHVITASVTDSGGLTGSASSTITVTEPITLTTRGYKVQGVRRVDLTWNGATGANVDVYADGLIVATTPNDGLFTHLLGGKGKGTFRYRVCDAGSTSVCSNVSTVVF